MRATTARIATTGRAMARTMPITTFSSTYAATSRISAASAVRPNDLLDDSFIALTSLDVNDPDRVRSLSGPTPAPPPERGRGARCGGHYSRPPSPVPRAHGTLAGATPGA